MKITLKYLITLTIDSIPVDYAEMILCKAV